MPLLINYKCDHAAKIHCLLPETDYSYYLTGHCTILNENWAPNIQIVGALVIDKDLIINHLLISGTLFNQVWLKKFNVEDINSGYNWVHRFTGDHCPRMRWATSKQLHPKPVPGNSIINKSCIKSMNHPALQFLHLLLK